MHPYLFSIRVQASWFPLATWIYKVMSVIALQSSFDVKLWLPCKVHLMSNYGYLIILLSTVKHIREWVRSYQCTSLDKRFGNNSILHFVVWYLASQQSNNRHKTEQNCTSPLTCICRKWCKHTDCYFQLHRSIFSFYRQRLYPNHSEDIFILLNDVNTSPSLLLDDGKESMGE